MYTSACMIRIMYRDLNGKRSSHVCKGYDAAYSFARDNLSEEEEIQLVVAKARRLLPKQFFSTLAQPIDKVERTTATPYATSIPKK